jgi:hypothetical protein
MFVPTGRRVMSFSIFIRVIHPHIVSFLPFDYRSLCFGIKPPGFRLPYFGLSMSRLAFASTLNRLTFIFFFVPHFQFCETID